MPPPPAAGELVIDRLAVKYTCYAQTARAGKKSAGFIVKFTFERGEGSGGRAQTNVKGGECKDVEQIPSVIEANIRAKLCALGELPAPAAEAADADHPPRSTNGADGGAETRRTIAAAAASTVDDPVPVSRSPPNLDAAAMDTPRLRNNQASNHLSQQSRSLFHSHY